ncbi:MAG: Methionyl-tRNA formyltransferase [Bacteroidetes bacterium ADurb.Bin141]|nr:methionyl-tRNA formyltransferase [Bacteroidia bacterium]OQB61257.1 MAG: Methionyl-tRNA formyltransferase [Bacteroidetes bacterium ADurb.Bin141]
MSKLKIIYSGTPEFAVEPLKKLVDNGYDIVAVITAPDKPAGRGMHLRHSAVKEFALKHGLNILQPAKLKDTGFLDSVRKLHADLHIVVAFRMMPEELWSMTPMGTFNLHASLLPQYRGAAPINRAIMNGEKETGVTTFFLRHEIDTGDIILSEKVGISENENAGELHDKLMHIGANLVLKTVELIESGKASSHPQQPDTPLKTAPKIFKDDCRIDWNKSAHEIFNQIRGLSPYPGAYTTLISKEGKETGLKIFKSVKTESDIKTTPGEITSNQKNYVRIGCANGNIEITEVQLEGKRKMNIQEFLRGFNFKDYIVKK